MSVAAHQPHGYGRRKGSLRSYPAFSQVCKRCVRLTSRRPRVSGRIPVESQGKNKQWDTNRPLRAGEYLLSRSARLSVRLAPCTTVLSTTISVPLFSVVKGGAARAGRRRRSTLALSTLAISCVLSQQQPVSLLSARRRLLPRRA